MTSPFDPRLRSDDGREKIFVTNKPVSTTTFFSGGDETGHEIVFNMADTDSEKHVDLYYNQPIYIVGGDVSFASAPLGAYFSIEVRLVTGEDESIAVQSYGDKIFIFGTGSREYVSQDRDVVPNEASPGVPMFIRLSLYNADGSGERDAAAAFKFSGNLFTYKETTV